MAGSGCGVSFEDDQITGLDFSDDAVIFAEIVEILAEALGALSEEAQTIGLRVSWVKTKAQEFGCILDAASDHVLVEDEKVEITESARSILPLAAHRKSIDVWALLGSDEFAEPGRVALSASVPENEGPDLQLIGHSSLALCLRDMDPGR